MEGPRAVKKDELQDLIDLVNYVFRTSSSKEPDMHICFPLFLSEKNLDNLLVMVDDNKPVSHMGLWINDFSYFGEPLKIGSLGSVCTDPNYRGQGLATQLMDEVLKHLEDQGVDLLLVSGGRGLYQRAGCQKAGQITWHNIPKNSLTTDFEVVVNPPIELMSELWLKEPLHSQRDPETFKTLVDAYALARCINCGSTVYLAKVNDTPLAYLQAVENKDGSVFLYEWAGERSILVELAMHIANLPETKELRWPIPSWENVLLEFLSQIQAPQTGTDSLSGTYKIVRFASFIEKIGNYLRLRFGAKDIKGFDEGDLQVLRLEDEEIKLDRFAMNELLLSGVLPENLPPKMKKLLQKATPLPLPWPIGFDYI